MHFQTTESATYSGYRRHTNWIGDLGIIRDDTGQLVNLVSGTGAEWLTAIWPQDADVNKQGWFNGNNNCAYCDGHVKTRRWGSWCPNEFTLQDDKADDPIMSCRNR